MGTRLPVFVNCRDRVSCLTAVVDWLERAGHERIYLVDNASSYPPLLDFYEQTPHAVVRLPDNVGHRAPWAAAVIEDHAPSEPYVVTDPDVLPVEECPPDAAAFLAELLERHDEVCKVGLGLVIDDLPDQYEHKKYVQAWEAQHWSTEVEPGLFLAPIDTTFAVYRAGQPFRKKPALRTGAPHMARHLAWYVNSDALTAEESFYRAHASPDVNSWNQRRLPPRLDGVFHRSPLARAAAPGRLATSVTHPCLPVYLIHWRAPEWCASAARSILASDGVRVELKIIDNERSGATMLRNALPESVAILSLSENAGYAGAANVALADWMAPPRDSEFCIIGSHDLHVEPDALTALLAVARAHPDIGIVGPALSGAGRSFGGRWDGTSTRLVKQAPDSNIVECDWASGTCLMVRRACAESVGRFDERFGSYVEDVDYCLRARDAGWRIVVVANARAHGLGSSSAHALRRDAANVIRLAAKRGGWRAAVGAVARTLGDIARGYAVTLDWRRNAAQRQASRHRAHEVLMGLLSLTRVPLR